LLRSPLPIVPVCAGSIDVRVLCSFVATTEQQYQLRSCHGVIDSESRPGVDPKFPHPIAAKPMIAEVSQLHSIDSAVNRDLCFCVTKLATPFHEIVFSIPCQVMENLVHNSIIVYKRIFVNENPYLIDSESDSNVYST
jgi:hypothetical protein